MPRYALQYAGPTLVLLNEHSGNRKTGDIPVTLTTGNTCPSTCPWLGQGCYAENGFTAVHWGRLQRTGNGLSWGEFCRRVARFSEGQIWRHNEAGDLPGCDLEIDTHMLGRLIQANLGRRGFTYTHKPIRNAREEATVRRANEARFTINLSADSLEEADAQAERKLGPIVLVLPHNSPKRGIVTPKGRKVVWCPALERAGSITCKTCGLCAVPWRKSIVAFRTHGRMRLLMTEMITQPMLPALEVRKQQAAWRWR